VLAGGEGLGLENGGGEEAATVEGAATAADGNVLCVGKMAAAVVRSRSLD